MPPAIAAVVSVVASVGIAALKVSALVKAILTIAVSLSIMLLAKKPKANKLNQGYELSTKFDPTVPREVLVGKISTGGSCHFTWVSSDNPSKKPNRYLYRVIQLSDRPINALLKVMEGSEELTFSGDVTTGWRSCTQHKDKKGDPKMWLRAYLGSDTPVADATLVSETGSAWTSDHKGTGIAYVIVKYDYDADAFSNGEPDLTFVVEGAKLYDDRKDSTVTGGSGSHRLNNYSTWEYSDTASVIIAQFLRGFYTNGVPIIGVQADARDMTAPMLFSAHNTCEQLVEIEPGGVFEKRYAAGMILKADEPAADILIDLQAAMDGKIFDRGGYITILPGADRTPVLNITPEDIDWSAEKSWQPKASLEQMLNHITSNFVDSEQNFQERNLPVLANAQWELDDGGERFTQFFSFRAVNKWTQGQRITKRLHLASRQSGTVAFVGGIWLIEAEQGDWVTITVPRWKMVSKYFEVQEINITADARVTMVCREVDPDNDIWDHSVDEVPRDDSSWTPPNYALPVPLLETSAIKLTDPISGAETYNLWVGLSDDPALYGSIVQYLELELTWDDKSEISSLGIFPIAQGKHLVTGLVPETTYYVRGRLRDNARAGDWTAWLTAITDVAILRASLSATMTPEAISLAANDAGVVTSYTPAETVLKVRKQDGTDVSTDFTLSVSSNPSALTTNIVGQTFKVTAGLDAINMATVILKATGTGTYTGIEYYLPFILIKNTVNTMIDAAVEPPAAWVAADSAGTVVNWTPATFEFTARLNDGTDISSSFTLSVPAGGNPDGITYTITGQTIEATGGLTVAESPGTLVIEATGSGAYTGVIIRRFLTIYIDQTGVALNIVLDANDRNDGIPSQTGVISTPTKYMDYPDGNVAYMASFSYTYSANPGDNNNVDGFAFGCYEANTNAAYTMLGPDVAAENWTVRYLNLTVGPKTYSHAFFKGGPTKWYTLAVAAFRKVDYDVDPKGYIMGPIRQYGPFQPAATQIITGTAITIGGQTANNVGTGASRANAAIDSNNAVATGTKIGGSSGQTAANVSDGAGRALAAIVSGTNKINTNAVITDSVTSGAVSNVITATSTTPIQLGNYSWSTLWTISVPITEPASAILFKMTQGIENYNGSALDGIIRSELRLRGANTAVFPTSQAMEMSPPVDVGVIIDTPVTYSWVYTGTFTPGSYVVYFEGRNVSTPSTLESWVNWKTAEIVVLKRV